MNHLVHKTKGLADHYIVKSLLSKLGHPLRMLETMHGTIKLINR